MTAFRVGLLGHGTVGRRSRRCSRDRADAIEAATGLRPELTGSSRARAGRLRGDPRGLGPDRRADRRHRPGARLRAARDAGRASHVVTANKQLLSQHGEELWAAARDGRPAALRGRGRRRGAGHPRAAGVAGRRPRRAHPRDRQRHDQLHPHRDGAQRRLLRGGARAGPAARLRRGRPGEDVDGRDAAAKMAILARLAFGTPGQARPGALRGHRAHHGRRHRVRAGARARAQAARDRRARRRRLMSVRVHPAFLYGGHPLASVIGAVQRRHGRVRGDHRDHDVGARARAARRRPAPCSATWSA